VIQLKNKFHPPKIFRWLLKKALPEDQWETSLGDFEEQYFKLANDKNVTKAFIWYLKNIIFLLPRKIHHFIWWRINMLKNYLLIAVRNILKHKGYSFINIMGLTIGIVCSVFILLYIQFELSYDKYHKNIDRIFRIASKFSSSDYGQSVNVDTPGILAPTISQDYQEVEHAVRIRKREYVVKYDKKVFYDNAIIFADANIFQIFSIPLIIGNPLTALQQPNTIIITKNLADSYLGNKDPVGEVFHINGKDYTITGVAKNPPDNTHFKYSILISMETIKNDDSMLKWDRWGSYTYIKIRENASAKAFENKIAQVFHKYNGEQLKEKGWAITVFLQPLTKIHLHSHYHGELEKNGNIDYLYFFSAICVLILAVGCINFINITTARATIRAKEVGIRKVMGANHSQLALQFLIESFLITLIATLLAFFVVSSSIPYFSDITGVNVSFTHLFQPLMILSFIVILFLIGFLAGSYPALFLSGLKTGSIIKGMTDYPSRKTHARKTLVVVQFTICIALIIFSLFIHNQLNFVQNMHLGFDKKNKLILPVKNKVRDIKYLQQNPGTIKNEFMKYSSISGVTILSMPPATWSRYWQMIFERNNTSVLIQVQPVDIDFIKEYNIKMLAGRPFQRDMSTDRINAVIINETAAKALGFSTPENAVGQKIRKITEVHEEFSEELNIIGVANDYNYYRLKAEILPAMIILYNGYLDYISLTVDSANLADTLSFAQKKFIELFPDSPFEYYFLDDYINSQFRFEKQIRTLNYIFTCICVFIACLGLLGLVAFIAEQRKKEIGIRKVLGSNVSSLIFLLTRDFSLCILLANLFAWPIAYIAVTNWLKDFAYRINVEIVIFLAAAVAAMAIALFTVVYQTIRAAKSNPIDVLRYE
jgi:putative ABC transport system permease protein